MITALARLGGRPVGVLASDPEHYGGGVTADASEKLARFVDICDQFHLPVVNLVDVPGFVIGTDAERAGTIRRGGRALFSVYQASVPWVSVLVRKVFGVAGAGHGDGSRLNLRYAWPSGDWGSLPMEGGLEAAYRRELEAADDPVALRAEIAARLDAVRSPFRTAERFSVEEIIDPRDTRPLLCDWAERAHELVAHELAAGPKARAPVPDEEGLMKALALNCTLKPSPAVSNTEALARVVLDALEQQDVDTEIVRVVDHDVKPGVSSRRRGRRRRVARDPREAPRRRDPRDRHAHVARQALERRPAGARADGRHALRGGRRGPPGGLQPRRGRGGHRQRGRRPPRDRRGGRRPQRHRLHDPGPGLDLLEPRPRTRGQLPGVGRGQGLVALHRPGRRGEPGGRGAGARRAPDPAAR